MVWDLNLILLPIAIILAIIALEIKDLLASALIMGGFSFVMCMIWTEMGAVDVAFTEAAVGAGVSTAFFVAAIYMTTRRTKD